MARVFVVGAYLPRGGGYMAYHVGHLIARRLGMMPIAVQVRAERADHGIFDYPEVFAAIHIDELLAIATPDDILVCNPIFSGRMLGMRFPGRSLMYVQGVNTFTVIDGFCTHYVAVSRFVHDHLALHYGWDVPVIPPFARADLIAPPKPWTERPPHSVAVVIKSIGDELLEALHVRLADRGLARRFTFTQLQGLAHRDLLDTLQRNRFLLNLVALEGYGLTSLEAMLSGCCVVGFHSGGGLDFMRPGLNAEVVGYPRLDVVVDRLVELDQDPARSQALAARGLADAASHTRAAFECRWNSFIRSELIG